jgi:hypothetical protein
VVGAITGPFIVVEEAVGFTIHMHPEEVVWVDWKFSDSAPRDIGIEYWEAGEVGIIEFWKA